MRPTRRSSCCRVVGRHARRSARRSKAATGHLLDSTSRATSAGGSGDGQFGCRRSRPHRTAPSPVCRHPHRTRRRLAAASLPLASSTRAAVAGVDLECARDCSSKTQIFVRLAKHRVTRAPPSSGYEPRDKNSSARLDIDAPFLAAATTTPARSTAAALARRQSSERVGGDDTNSRRPTIRLVERRAAWSRWPPAVARASWHDASSCRLSLDGRRVDTLTTDTRRTCRCSI